MVLASLHDRVQVGTALKQEMMFISIRHQQTTNPHAGGDRKAKSFIYLPLVGREL